MRAARPLAPPPAREPSPDAAVAHDYGQFLRLDRLFSATWHAPDHPDGRFFVAVHQTHELWFEVILHELATARDRLIDGAVPAALYRLRRVVAIDRLLVQQLDTLTTISPGSFATLRPALGTASGFQSVRFREIEYVSGLRERDPAGYPNLAAAERERLRRRLREPSLWDAFRALLARYGVVDPVLLYRGPADQGLVAVAEAMLDHDEAWAMWRTRHAVVVERIIGRKPGTGGSAGVSYLRSRRDVRFFPQLWELRAAL